MDFLIQKACRVFENYGSIISHTLIRNNDGSYELRLFGMPARLDMELLKTSISESENVVTKTDKYGRPIKVERKVNSYPICIPVTDKDTYHIRVNLYKDDYARKLIEIDCAIRRYKRKAVEGKC